MPSLTSQAAVHITLFFIILMTTSSVMAINTTTVAPAAPNSTTGVPLPPDPPAGPNSSSSGSAGSGSGSGANATTTTAPETYSLIPTPAPPQSKFVMDAWLIALICFFALIMFGLAVWAANRQKAKKNRDKETKMRQVADEKFRSRMSEMEKRVDKL